jgi:hypothetical protein
MDRGVRNNFPEGITFSVSAQSDSPIERVRLRYKILPDGTAAIGLAEFTPATSVSTTFELAGNDPPRIYLPPGTVIEYFWEVTDADGKTATTETETFFYDDVRFDWRTVEANGVTIYFYSGSEELARQMLDTAVETIDSMSALLQIEVPFPVKVWVYENRDDMRPALARRSETYEASVITAGVRVASDTVLVLGNASFDTLRHEVAHVVTAVAGEGPFGSLPAWLDEGTAVWAQGDPGGFRSAVESAIQRGNVFSVRQITSYQGDPSGVGLFYGQSWSLVSYLIDTYGQEKFAQLFAEIKGGKRVDNALLAVYGFDQDGLDEEWRAAHGLPPRVTPAPEPERPAETAAPTRRDGGAPQTGGGNGTSAAAVVGVLLGVLGLAGAVGLLGLTLARRLR